MFEGLYTRRDGANHDDDVSARFTKWSDREMSWMSSDLLQSNYSLLYLCVIYVLSFTQCFPSNLQPSEFRHRRPPFLHSVFLLTQDSPDLHIALNSYSHG